MPEIEGLRVGTIEGIPFFMKTEIKLGQKVKVNGYEGKVYAFFMGMVVVKLERGEVCVDPSDVEVL